MILSFGRISGPGCGQLYWPFGSLSGISDHPLYQHLQLVGGAFKNKKISNWKIYFHNFEQDLIQYLHILGSTRPLAASSENNGEGFKDQFLAVSSLKFNIYPRLR